MPPAEGRLQQEVHTGSWWPSIRRGTPPRWAPVWMRQRQAAPRAALPSRGRPFRPRRSTFSCSAIWRGGTSLHTVPERLAFVAGSGQACFIRAEGASRELRERFEEMIEGPGSDSWVRSAGGTRNRPDGRSCRRHGRVCHRSRRRWLRERKSGQRLQFPLSVPLRLQSCFEWGRAVQQRGAVGGCVVSLTTGELRD
jgi:hypothetical protein